MTVLEMAPELDAFAAERDDQLLELAALYLPAIAVALNESDESERNDMLFETLQTGFDIVFEELGGKANRLEHQRAFLSDMRQSIERLEPDGTEAQRDRLATWFATATYGAATLGAAAKSATKTWVTMRDDAVREIHQRLQGNTVVLGGKFLVGESETPTLYPGQPVGPIENWINCRCVLRIDAPVVASAVVAAGGFSGVVLVALPEGENTVTYEDGDTTELHQTIAYLGTIDQLQPGEREAILELAEAMAAQMTPFTARVAGKGTLGADQDSIAIMEAPELQALHEMARGDEMVGQMYDERNGHPTWISHITGEGLNAGDEVTYDRVAAWFGGDDHISFTLGEEMSDPRDESDDELPTSEDDPDMPDDEDEPGIPDELIEPVDGNIPVYGVAVLEGEESGDGRMFALGSLTHRDLPLPLTWQRASAPEHGGEVVVGRLDVLEKRGNVWHYSGELLGDVPETEEVINLIAQRALRGVSIAADSGVTEDPTEEEMLQAAESGVTPPTTWKAARISGLTIVQIPAFQEGFIALGFDPDMAEPLAAAGDVETFKRGPGWVTHPKETERIHRYWTTGKGRAKIAWGTNGDFTRCTRYLGKYISPRFLNRTCAQWHHDALGYWPGTEGMPGNPPKGTAKRRARSKLELDDCTDCEDTAMIAASASTPPNHQHSITAPAITLVAAAPMVEMPMSWLDDPCLDGPTPLTVLASGQVFGHIAKWGTCHIGMGGECIEPPRSYTDYAYYHLGEVQTDEGRVACGSLTLGTGHADLDLNFGGTKSHYDNTGTQVAKVRAGEDEHGIWVAGGLCLGVSDDQRRILMGAGGISGDWRKIGGHLELVAGLAVNVPGFPVPRIGLAASAGGQMALVAAGVVVGSDDIDAITDAVIARMEVKAARAARLATLRSIQTAEVRSARLALINSVEV